MAFFLFKRDLIMPRPELLTEYEIQSKLSELANWARNGNIIEREFKFPDFASAVGMINAIAIVAEKSDHHPDILLFGWNNLKIMISTHDKGGITQLDFDLAKKIDKLNF